MAVIGKTSPRRNAAVTAVFTALIAIAFISFSAPTGAQEDEILFVGDVNCDNVLDLRDALLIAQIAASASEPDPGCAAEGPGQTDTSDLNGDGSVTADDALFVLRCTAGLVPCRTEALVCEISQLEAGCDLLYIDPSTEDVFVLPQQEPAIGLSGSGLAVAMRNQSDISLTPLCNSLGEDVPTQAGDELTIDMSASAQTFAAIDFSLPIGATLILDSTDYKAGDDNRGNWVIDFDIAFRDGTVLTSAGGTYLSEGYYWDDDELVVTRTDVWGWTNEAWRNPAGETALTLIARSTYVSSPADGSQTQFHSPKFIDGGGSLTGEEGRLIGFEVCANECGAAGGAMYMTSAFETFDKCLPDVPDEDCNRDLINAVDKASTLVNLAGQGAVFATKRAADQADQFDVFVENGPSFLQVPSIIRAGGDGLCRLGYLPTPDT